MKTINYLLLMSILCITTMCFADVITVDQKAKALKIIAKQMDIDEKEVEKEIEKEAVTKKVKKVVDDIIERIKRQNIDKAKSGVDITEKEIEDALDLKYNAVSTVSDSIFSYEEKE